MSLSKTSFSILFLLSPSLPVFPHPSVSLPVCLSPFLCSKPTRACAQTLPFYPRKKIIVSTLKINTRLAISTFLSKYHRARSTWPREQGRPRGPGPPAGRQLPGVARARASAVHGFLLPRDAEPRSPSRGPRLGLRGGGEGCAAGRAQGWRLGSPAWAAPRGASRAAPAPGVLRGPLHSDRLLPTERSGLRIRQWPEDAARLRWPRRQEPTVRLRALARCARVSAGPASSSPQPSKAQARRAPVGRDRKAGSARHPRD